MARHILWNFKAELSLIKKIQSNPGLWNTSHPLFPKKNIKKRKYEEIARELREAFPYLEGIDSDAVMIKFNILKGSFRRKLAQIQNLKSSTGEDHIPKWIYFKYLSFLTDVITPGDNTSNIDNAVSEPCSIEISINGDVKPESEEYIITPSVYVIDNEKEELAAKKRKTEHVDEGDPLRHEDSILGGPTEGMLQDAYTQCELRDDYSERKLRDDYAERKLRNDYSERRLRDDYAERKLWDDYSKRKLRDDYTVFGEYVAAELRQLSSDARRRRLKLAIQKAIILIEEEETIGS